MSNTEDYKFTFDRTFVKDADDKQMVVLSVFPEKLKDLIEELQEAMYHEEGATLMLHIYENESQFDSNQTYNSTQCFVKAYEPPPKSNDEKTTDRRKNVRNAVSKLSSKKTRRNA